MEDKCLPANLDTEYFLQTKLTTYSGCGMPYDQTPLHKKSRFAPDIGA